MLMNLSSGFFLAQIDLGCRRAPKPQQTNNDSVFVLSQASAASTKVWRQPSWSRAATRRSVSTWWSQWRTGTAAETPRRMCPNWWLVSATRSRCHLLFGKLTRFRLCWVWFITIVLVLPWIYKCRWIWIFEFEVSNELHDFQMYSGLPYQPKVTPAECRIFCWF